MCCYLSFENSNLSAGIIGAGPCRPWANHLSKRGSRPTTIDSRLRASGSPTARSYKLGGDVTPRIIFNMKDAHADELLVVVGVLAVVNLVVAPGVVTDLHDDLVRRHVDTFFGRKVKVVPNALLLVWLQL